MASSKRKKHGAGYVVLIAVLILVLLAVVAAVTGYSLVARRVKALQAGAAFTFDYEITSTADSPALYTILQKTGSTKGTVNGATINGIKPLDKPIEETPANDAALVKQIYLVPFKGVTYDNLSSFLKK